MDALVFLLALIKSSATVIFNLQLFGVSLGVWFVGFIVFDILLVALVFTGRRFRGGGS